MRSASARPVGSGGKGKGAHGIRAGAVGNDHAEHLHRRGDRALDRGAERARHDRGQVHARALALADGREQIVIVVVDSCMMGRPLLDEAKALAAARTGIPRERILISATHAHSAPASMGCLGTDADPRYVPLLRDKLVEAIAAAQANLEPAQAGWAKTDADAFNATRQWIRRPDRLAEDPFGNQTLRANMHAARNLDDVTGEAGPEDPDLTLISIQARDGRPLAVLGNFSMHYFGDKDISAETARSIQSKVSVSETRRPSTGSCMPIAIRLLPCHSVFSHVRACRDKAAPGASGLSGTRRGNCRTPAL